MRCQMHHFEFNHCDVVDTTFIRCDAHASKTLQTLLEGCQIRYTNLSDSDIDKNKIVNGDIFTVTLEQTSISDNILEKTRIQNTNTLNTKLYTNNVDNESEIERPAYCPDSGQFIAWKKIDANHILKLLVTADAKRVSLLDRSCKINKAIIIGIERPDGTKHKKEITPNYKRFQSYKTGETLVSKYFDERWWDSNGDEIRCFINRDDALKYQ